MLDHPTTDESTIGDSRSVDSILDDSTTDHSILYVYRIPYTRLDAYLNSDDFPCFNHASQNCFVLQLFHLHALRKARKIPPVFNCSSASKFWGSLAECFFLQMMTQHYCLNSRWFNIRCLSNRQLSNSNRWLQENHDVRKTPRSFASMSTCLETSYTPVLVLSIGFPSLKPSPQLARLFVSVWWCLGYPCCNFSCCRSNRWCRSCCKRYRFFFIASNVPYNSQTEDWPEQEYDQDFAEGVTEEEAWSKFFAQMGIYKQIYERSYRFLFLIIFKICCHNWTEAHWEQQEYEDVEVEDAWQSLSFESISVCNFEHVWTGRCRVMVAW